MVGFALGGGTAIFFRTVWVATSVLVGIKLSRRIHRPDSDHAIWARSGVAVKNNRRPELLGVGCDRRADLGQHGPPLGHSAVHTPAELQANSVVPRRFRVAKKIFGFWPGPLSSAEG